MKKVVTLILVFLLVLGAAQTAFADNTVGFMAGYTGEFNEYLGHYSRSSEGFKIDLSLRYYVANKFSLSSKADMSFLKATSSTGTMWQYTYLNFDFFGRYDLMKSDSFNFSLQTGLMDSLAIHKGIEPYNFFMLAVGLYTDVILWQKVKFYANLKIPFAVFSSSLLKSNSGFFKVFLYDVSFGAVYSITPNISVGIENNLSSREEYGIRDAGAELSRYLHFTVGAKLFYSF